MLELESIFQIIFMLDLVHIWNGFELRKEIEFRNRKGVQSVPEDNVDKKRKEISPELELESNQHSSSITSSHLAPIPGQINSDSKELKVSQAKVTLVFPHEVCIDGWTITYTEFQPRKIKWAKKRSNQTKINLHNPQANNTLSNNSVEYDITKDLAKRKCYHCQ